MERNTHKVDYPTGAGPVSVVIADLDGDDRTDLAVASSTSGTVSVLLGRGDGTFAPKVDTPCGDGPRWVAAADLDGDGAKDLAVARDSGVITVLWNHRDGTFARRVDLLAGAKPSSVVAADLNGDGKPDLAVAGSERRGSVSVLLSEGAGSFAAKVDYPAGTDPRSIVAADLNRDGKTDLVVACHFGDSVRATEGRTVSVLLGRGDGTFDPRMDFATTSSPAAFAVADLDGDGRADLAQGHKSVDVRELDVLLGGGDGTFRRGWNKYLGIYRAPTAITAGDFDADGIPDLAIGFARTVLVIRGNGDGTFHGEDYFGLPGTPQALAAADLDGDGMVDLVSASSESTGLAVLFGRGDGTFRGEGAFGVGSRPIRIVVGDFDGNGAPDALVTTAENIDAYTVLLGDGRGGMRALPGGHIEDAHREIATADLDGDGKLDLVCANRQVLLGNGDGTFRALPRPPGRPPPLGVAPWAQNSGVSLAVSDLDGDGELDLARVTAQARGVALAFGEGDGTFQSDRTILLGASTTALAAADLDGDGRPDLAVSSDEGLLLLFGKGDGTFEPAVICGEIAKPKRLVAADVDGDGRMDLVVEDPERGGTSVLRSAGGRRFARTATVPATGKIAVADLDGDRIPDLVVGSERSPGTEDSPRHPAKLQPIAFFVGIGDGTYQAARRFGVGAEELALADLDRDGLPAADLDGDGSVDLVGYRLTREGTLLHVFRNAGQRTFVPTHALQIEGSAMGLVVRDLNGDGIPDLATGTSFLIGNGDGTFQAPRSFSLEANAFALIDLDQDGLPDVVLTHIQSPFLRVEMNTSR